MGRTIYWLLVVFLFRACTAEDSFSLTGFPEVATGAGHTITCNNPGGSNYVWRSPKGVTSSGYSHSFTATYRDHNGLWTCEVMVNGQKKIGMAHLCVYCSGKFVTSASTTNPSLGDPFEFKCRVNSPSGSEVLLLLTTPVATSHVTVAAVQENPNTCGVFKEKDNRRWSSSTVCQTSKSNQNFTLMILSARKTDEGYWRCLDYSDSSCWSRPVRIGIAKPPRDPPSLTGFTPIVGTNHTLTCNAWQLFVRPLTYTWFKDNVQISQENSSTWLLSPVAKGAMGKYRCEVKNKVSNTSVNAEKALAVYYCRKGWSGYQGECYKHFTTKKGFKQAEASCVTYRGHLTSVCSQDELKFIAKMAGPGHTWIGSEVYYPTGRNPNLVWTDGSNCPDWRKLQPTLTDADFKDKTRTPGHKDAARLHVYNTSVNLYDSVYVTLYPFICKAKPMRPPKDPPTLTGFTNPIEGTANHTLTCDAWQPLVGALVYSWFKDGVLVQKGNDSTLTLDHVVKGSTGEYSCVVTDTVTDAKVQAKGKLDVYYPPAWNPATPHAKIAPTVPGGRVHLTLDVISNPVPSSIKWFYEKGNSLTEVTYSIQTRSATVRVLIIPSVQEKDFGTYKVNATNAAGSTQFTFSIAKINIPAVPSGLTVAETGKDFLLVSFQAGDSGGAHQTFTLAFYEKDKYQQTIQGINGPANTKNVTYKIRHLAPGTRYYIKVKSVHDYRFRQSSYSGVVEAKTLGDAPGRDSGTPALIGTVVAVILGVALLVVVVVLVVMMHRHSIGCFAGRRQPESPTSNNAENGGIGMESVDEFDNTAYEDDPSDEHVYGNDPSDEHLYGNVSSQSEGATDSIYVYENPRQENTGEDAGEYAALDQCGEYASPDLNPSDRAEENANVYEQLPRRH